MSSDGPITLTLPIDLSRRIRENMAEHGYAGPLDVIKGGLDALEPAAEHVLLPWQWNEVNATCDELDRDRSQVKTMQEIEATLEAEYQIALKAG